MFYSFVFIFNNVMRSFISVIYVIDIKILFFFCKIFEFENIVVVWGEDKNEKNRIEIYCVLIF